MLVLAGVEDLLGGRGIGVFSDGDIDDVGHDLGLVGTLLKRTSQGDGGTGNGEKN